MFQKYSTLKERWQFITSFKKLRQNVNLKPIYIELIFKRFVFGRQSLGQMKLNQIN